MKFIAVRHFADEKEEVVALDVIVEVTDKDGTMKAARDS